ncbi:hypothetical protein [Rhodopseudomonas sp. BR0G17]|uniref:hypothetical protein n=1 Tax=Rhodopseudomonas sp. BR0G17 TaxID=2269368 RepID=UPI0013E03050|nr:hypothetical protein [Rhodopseudomonas sp. BR0G17]NEW95526.1 hypothetical protein [Rhodopseudomonas sp. BR0G17]
MSEFADDWIPQKLRREAKDVAEAVARSAIAGRMVVAATTAAPLIVAAVSKAGHGPEQLQPHQLAEAIRLAKQLVVDLENAQLALGWNAGAKVTNPER